MTTDYTPYVIIDDVTMSKVMERRKPKGKKISSMI